MQSGISASAELQSAFQTLLSTPSQRGLLASISGESIVPGATIPASGSFYDDLSKLQQHLAPNAAQYILLRRPDTAGATSTGSLVAVTYVPNAAPVRQKTLFASTRLSLLRELGSENFGESIFCTEAAELTVEGWKKHEAHTVAENPLTQEERDLENIKAAEATESGGTSSRRGHTTGGLKMGEGEGVRAALEGLKMGGTENLVQLKIDLPTETLVLISSTPATPRDIPSQISATEPRYSYYRHDEAAYSPILFIYTCPTGSKIKERMVYASARITAQQFGEQEIGLNIAKKLEASDPSDITAETVEAEFAPEKQPEQKTGFARPKRPGRR